MITNYYTLRALVQAWQSDIVGCIVGDVFSQTRDELILALARPDGEWMVRLSVRSPFQYIFRTEGYHKARKNVATLFPAIFDRQVTALRIAPRDRMLFFDLDDDSCIQIALFGPRANVFLVDAEGLIQDAFQQQAKLTGTPAPAPRPAPALHTLADFEARWRTDVKTIEKALTRALPLFDRTLAREVLYRAGVDAGPPDACSEAVRAMLFEQAMAVQQELAAPSPCIYWQNGQPEQFALTRLHHFAGVEEEAFDTVEKALQVYVRRALGRHHFHIVFDPLHKALTRAEAHYHNGLNRMMDELSKDSRADQYERWGHLLMASPQDVPPRADTVILPDLFTDHAPVTIPLDAQRSAIENAQRYYDRARHTRQARAQAEERLLATEHKAKEATALLAGLQSLKRVKEVEQFKRSEAERLAPFLGQQQAAASRIPFRRYVLRGGYEVWVGRNARQNDSLTFRHARKYDRWLHARGVPGSHVVLRVPHRQAQPERSLLEQAAGIAAYYSKARGSHLVPVIITERKHVRKAKGGPPGAVLVDRETVLIVEPGLPD